jgi:hypothetical protein
LAFAAVLCVRRRGLAAEESEAGKRSGRSALRPSAGGYRRTWCGAGLRVCSHCEQIETLGDHPEDNAKPLPCGVVTREVERRPSGRIKGVI